jgi:L,D-transpeptidase YcbB
MLQKTVIIIVVAALVFTGCKNSGKDSTDGKNTANNERPILRDLSINKDNSFNDIFLDSGSVEQFIIAEELNDTISNAIRGFYNARNFEYAWFSSEGLIEQCFSFRSLYSSDNSTDVLNKSLENRLDRMRAEKDKTVEAKDPSTIKTELQITERFIRYALENYAQLGISPAGLGTYIPAKRTKIVAMVDAILADNKVNNTYAALNESYRLLKIPLQKYSAIEKKGGWHEIPLTTNKYSTGNSDPAIAGIKKRLQITGELTGNDTSQIFNAELELAIKAYQLTHGFAATGAITQDLVKDLNISALARLQQLLINMQRMRWMPTHPDGMLIIVNIPAFEVYVDSGKNTLFKMDLVVGKEGYKTTMFSGNLNQVVFSPYWNIPPSIVKEEILPGLRRDKNYLKKRDMEITGRDGDLPVVRQRPGEKNALGKVKFLFPNSFNIYMHDTHEKGFFNRSERDLSHGCVRLSDATKMANYLLRNSNEWSPEKIKAAMNSGKEQYVKLKDRVPVIITYYTAWVGNNGELHFVDDIYEHDKHMAQKMFVDPQ